MERSETDERAGLAGTEGLVTRVVEEAVRRSAEGAGLGATTEGWAEEVRPVIEGMLAAVGASGAGPVAGSLEAAFEFGRTVARRPAGAGEVAREVLLVARALEQTLEDRGVLEPTSARRLRRIADDTVVRALDGHLVGQVERRDGWLSFYSHEMRNRLNTLVNAVWLLKNSEQGPAQTQRICEIAERAARRLEELVKEARELEVRFAEEPPLRPGRRPPAAE